MLEQINKVEINVPKIKVPKFKGTTKIELFDNGEKVEEHVDDNMMTKALDHLFNPTLYSSFTSGIDRLKNWSYINSSLGGILLYSDPIEENENTLYAPVTNTCTGHAGNEYSGMIQTRGSLNTNESGAVDDKSYKWVWDFPTDKANGKISCVSLTSCRGGIAGFGKNINVDYGSKSATNIMSDFDTPDSNYGSSVFSLGFMLADEVSSINTSKYRATYCGIDNKGRHRISWFYILSDTIYLYVAEFYTDPLVKDMTECYNSVSSPKVDILFELDKPNASYTYNVYTTSQLASHKYSTYSFYEDEKLYICANTNNNNSIAYCTFDLDTKAFSEWKTVVTSNAGAYSYPWTKVKDYWFQMNDKAVYKVPFEGGNCETFTLSMINSINWDQACLSHIDNNIYVGYGGHFLCFDYDDPSIFCYFYGNTYSSTYNTGTYISQDIDGVTAKYISFSFNKPNIIYMSVHGNRVLPYLATINNLSSPVTKTNAQTMKITYQITQVEEEEND